MNKVNWPVVQTLVTILLILIGWGISVEVRLSKSDSIGDVSKRVESYEQTTINRISNLENALMPVLVEYKLGLLLKEKAPALPPVPPAPSPTSMVVPKARKDAENWARSQLPNPAQQSIER